MQVEPCHLYNMYLEVLKEFNESEYSRQSGHRVSFERLHLVEARTVMERIETGGTLLDIGTGCGLIPRIAQRFGCRVISVDFPGAGGWGALGRLMQFGITGYYVNVGKERVPLADDSVDIVFAGNVIEHQPHSPKPFMEEVRRLLRPGGYLVIDTKNAVDLKTRLKMLAGIHNWPTVDFLYSNDFNFLHHKEYVLAELVRLVELAGLRVVEKLALESFFYKSLKRLGTLHAMSAKFEDRSQFGTGFNCTHPYEYARLICLLLTVLVPSLRSDILVVGEKISY